MMPIIDAHLDLAWNALSWNRDLTETVEQIRAREATMIDDDARGRCTTSLPELRRANVQVCLATILVRAKRNVQPSGGHRRIDVDVATQEIAYAHGRGQRAYYDCLERRGHIRMIRSAADLADHWSSLERGAPARLGVILAMEGADPIIDPDDVAEWWDLGLRSLGLAHYGPSHYAVGTGDTGPLTPKGVELLHAMDRVGMILDLTHLSDPSFFQAVELFGGPVMASHNNCRALVPGDRQFSDEQLRKLIDRGGVVGIAFDAWMLQREFIIGKSAGDSVPLESVVDHIDHVCQLAGDVRHVAIGSDLDGGFGTEQSPAGIETIADILKLQPLLQGRGYSDDDINRIFYENWLQFLMKSLPAR